MTPDSRILPLLALLSLGWQPLHSQDLATRLDARLDAPGLDRHHWGVAVTDLNGRLLHGRNADRLFIPASNTKLVVSAAATVLLGPDFTVNTSIHANGPLVEGVLRGDLVLYGRGDPTFSRRCYQLDTVATGACDTDPAARFRDLANQLRTLGLTRVEGDLVGDGSYFDGELVHPAWETYDLNWWYAATVSGLGFNDNSVDLRVARPSPGMLQPEVTMGPEVGVAVLDNRAIIGPAGSDRSFDVTRSQDGTRFIATGLLPADASDRTMHSAVADPDLYAALALRRELLAAGIVVLGDTRSTVDSTDYAAARATPALAEVTSRPLRDWVFPILNTSQNWFAEMLLKQLGRQLGASGSWREGLQVERRFLIDSVGIDSTHFALSDGSGLAANNLVTPRAFVQLLAWMRRHPNYADFARGLPVSGSPGSLLRRFTDTPLEGRVRAKTGTITRVNTLSGYVELDNGEVLVFSVQANNHNIGSTRMMAAIDSVVVELGRR